MQEIHRSYQTQAKIHHNWCKTLWMYWWWIRRRRRRQYKKCIHKGEKKKRIEKKYISNLFSYINGWYRGKVAFNARCFAWQHSKITYKIKDKIEHHSANYSMSTQCTWAFNTHTGAPITGVQHRPVTHVEWHTFERDRFPT